MSRVARFDESAVRPRRRKPSPRTDATEKAIRRWLVQRHCRVGDRLPADTELAQLLGVARSTVISALDRLEENGIIVRRQGSGTFVSASPLPDGVESGIEVLGGPPVQPIGDGMRLSRVDIGRVAADPAVAEALRLPPGTAVRRIRRLVTGPEGPAALLVDFIAPGIEVGGPDMPPRLSEGGTVLDELLDAGVAVAYARTGIRPVAVGPDQEPGATLGVTETTAALEVRETTFASTGEPVKHSVDTLLPSAWEVTVLRQLATARADTPTPVVVGQERRTA